MSYHNFIPTYPGSQPPPNPGALSPDTRYSTEPRLYLTSPRATSSAESGARDAPTAINGVSGIHGTNGTNGTQDPALSHSSISNNPHPPSNFVDSRGGGSEASRRTPPQGLLELVRHPDRHPEGAREFLRYARDGYDIGRAQTTVASGRREARQSTFPAMNSAATSQEPSGSVGNPPSQQRSGASGHTANGYTGGASGPPGYTHGGGGYPYSNSRNGGNTYGGYPSRGNQSSRYQSSSHAHDS